jgi:hypothetical protein
MTDLLAETLANPAIGTIGTALVMAVLALWLAAAWWAYSDAARRTESSLAGFVAAGWIILSSPLLLPLSLAAYTFARPQVSAADRRTRSLAAELAATPMRPACAVCAEPIDDAWLRCPSCTSWLASPCAHCGAWSDGSLEICPWCGGETRDQPYVEGFAGSESTSLRGRRRRMAWRANSPTLPSSKRRDGQRISLTPGAPRTTTTTRVPS